MTATNKILSIIAFYLSEYDMKAVKALGFQTRTAAINSMSAQVGSGNNYLKLRRDEFDALPDSASPRKGWRNRPPLKDVVDLAAYLHNFTFDELTEIVKTFLVNSSEDDSIPADTGILIDPELHSEEEIEQIMNMTDPSAGIRIVTQTGRVRVYNRSIITQLKHLYRGCCQICGNNPIAEFGEDICEAHHIEPFAESHNNNPQNIIIVCPNHHRLIHRLEFRFVPAEQSFCAEGIGKLEIKLDYHLKDK